MKEKAFKISIVAIFILAVFLRFKAYLFNVSFWFDESALALNIINRSFLGLLKPLGYTQCAPYGFLVLTKLITKLFGTSEYAFRFLPFLASILSIPAFYFLSKKVLNKKWSILIANYLFVVNSWLLYYTKEFKQYSVEMFFAIILTLYLSSLDLKTLSVKKCLALGFVFFIMFLFSMPVAFILAAFCLYLIYKNKKTSIKQIFFISLPFILCALPYYFIYLKPSKIMMTAFWYQLWGLGYIKFTPEFLYQFFVYFFNFTFGSNYNPLPALILTSIGTFLIFKDKKRINAIILLIFLVAILASILHLYPILHRLHLYLTPFVLLIAVKTLDVLSFKCKRKIIVAIFIVLLFAWCLRTNSVNHLKRITKPDMYSYSVQRKYMKLIKDNAAPDDIFVFSAGALANYIYYFRYYDIKNETVKNFSKGNNYKDVENAMAKLTPGKTYWFYQDSHEASKKLAPFIKKWAHENKNVEILFEEELQKPCYSYLLKVKIKH